MHSILDTIVARCEKSMQNILDYAAGVREYSFAAMDAYTETGKNVVRDKAFLQDKIDEYDNICVDDADSATSNITEFQEVFVSQRDFNHRYSERGKLFEAGADTVLGDYYRGGMVQSTYKRLGELEQKS